MANSNYIGLDVGKARVGFASGGDSARLASALVTVPTTKAASKLKKLIKDESAVGVVVGLPRGLSGQETEQTEWVRQWVNQLKTKIDIPIYAQDEALTTKLAEIRSITGKKSADIDAIAAAIILQDFLESPEAERVVW